MSSSLIHAYVASTFRRYSLYCSYGGNYWESQFTVKFKSDRTLPTKRKAQFSRLEAAAYVGGTLGEIEHFSLSNLKYFSIFTGLLAGFSLLSIFELFYFCILRPIFSWAETLICRLSGSGSKVHPIEDEAADSPFDLFDYLSNFLRASSIASVRYVATEKLKVAK